MTCHPKVDLTAVRPSTAFPALPQGFDINAIVVAVMGVVGVLAQQFRPEILDILPLYRVRRLVEESGNGVEGCCILGAG